MQEQVLTAGTTLFEKGDPGEGLYVINSGLFSVVNEGQEIATLEAGSYVGEMAAFSHAPRSATIVAKEDSVVSLLDADAFQEIVRTQPDISIQLLAALAERLAHAMDQ
jgi:CRP/FNR family transcriptional regulator